VTASCGGDRMYQKKLETKNLKNKTVEFAIRIRKTGENITLIHTLPLW
jgi:hypothetical protein